MSFNHGCMIVEGPSSSKLNVPEAANDNFKPNDDEPPPAVPGPAQKGPRP